MMTFGKLPTVHFHDPRLKSISDDARYLWTYLHASPHGNSSGFFSLSPQFGYLIPDLGWSQDRGTAAMSQLVDVGAVVADAGTGAVFMLDYFDINEPRAISNLLSILDRWTTGELPKASGAVTAAVLARTIDYSHTWLAERDGSGEMYTKAHDLLGALRTKLEKMKAGASGV